METRGRGHTAELSAISSCLILRPPPVVRRCRLCAERSCRSPPGGMTLDGDVGRRQPWEMVAMSACADVSFASGGLRCAGRLYLPAHRVRRAPCVVMAHGTTATMDFGLRRYAQRFADARLAGLMFDYRHFGLSEGEPRQLVDTRRQVADPEIRCRLPKSCARMSAVLRAPGRGEIPGGYAVRFRPSRLAAGG